MRLTVDRAQDPGQDGGGGGGLVAAGDRFRPGKVVLPAADERPLGEDVRPGVADVQVGRVPGGFAHGRAQAEGVRLGGQFFQAGDLGWVAR
jgi:hypothetical protein